MMLPSWHRKIQRGDKNPSKNPQDQRERLEQKIGRRFLLHPGKLTCPLKRDYFNRKYIFQPSTFRGHVSLRECKVHEGCCGSPITNSKWGSVKLKKERYIHYFSKKKRFSGLVVGSYESITNPIGFVVFLKCSTLCFVFGPPFVFFVIFLGKMKIPLLMSSCISSELEQHETRGDVIK